MAEERPRPDRSQDAGRLARSQDQGRPARPARIPDPVLPRGKDEVDLEVEPDDDERLRREVPPHW